MSDIGYLAAHGRREVFPLYIDSGRRDKRAYKTPSEYAIVFLAPFENVTSVQVLQADVPNSAYSVETDTNTISFRASPDQPFQSGQIAIGNHTPESLMAELRSVLGPSSIDVQPLTQPFAIRQQLRFTSSFPFEFDITNTSLRDVIGFSQVIDPVAAVQLQSFSDRITGDKTEVPIFRQASDDGDATAPLGELTEGVVMSFGRHVRQVFRPTTTVGLARVGAYMSLFGTSASQTVRVAVVQLMDDGWDRAVSGGPVFQGSLVVSYDPSPTGKYYEVLCDSQDIVSGRLYAVEFWSDTSDTSGASGPMLHHAPLRTSSIAGARGGLKLLVDGRWVAFYDLERAARCIVTGVPFQYALVPPGIVNLGGFRYLNLRCPEVEQYLNRTRMYENLSPGIATINLAKDLISERFVAITGPKKEFATPVSRITRLSFRFETPNGDVYDFKGVDHTLKIEISCYLPPDDPSDQSALLTSNPSYTPNIVDQVRRRREPMTELLQGALPVWARPVRQRIY